MGSSPACCLLLDVCAVTDLGACAGTFRSLFPAWVFGDARAARSGRAGVVGAGAGSGEIVVGGGDHGAVAVAAVGLAMQILVHSRLLSVF